MNLQLQKHTSNPTWCWRVIDADTGATWGYGLTEADAARLKEQLDGRH